MLDLFDHCLTTFFYLIPMIIYLAFDHYFDNGAIFMGIVTAFGLQLFVRAVIKFEAQRSKERMRH